MQFLILAWNISYLLISANVILATILMKRKSELVVSDTRLPDPGQP